MNKPQTIYVAGHRGMVGSAIVRCLQHQHPGARILTRTHAGLDLTNQKAVGDFFKSEKIDQVYLAAAKVGGIQANNLFPAQFIYENLTIQTNVVHAAHATGVSKLLMLGSSCIYPRDTLQPMPENALLTGKLELTNEPYAIAKIAGIKLCESYNRQYGCDYRAVMPTNLYGPGDNYHPEHSHVIPGLLRRFHEAKQSGAGSVTIWGSGRPRREFLFVDDMARASCHVMELSSAEYAAQTEPQLSHINVGFGSDISILELAEEIAAVVGFKGGIELDSDKPDGTPQKLMDSSRLAKLGWRPSVDLRAGLQRTYKDFVETSARDMVRG
jgi:GDP-L-fucose synthase